MGAQVARMKRKKASKRSSLWRNVRKTWKYVKPAKWNLAGYVAIAVTEGIIGVVAPMLAAQVILNITNNHLEQLLLSALAVFGVDCIVNLSHYLKQLFYRRIYRRAMVGLQVDLVRETLKIETSEINSKSSGLFIERINGDAADIAGLFMDYTFFIAMVISNIGVMVAIFILNRYMFVFAVVVSLTIFLINRRRISRQNEIRREVRKLGEQRTGLVGETVRGINDIKALNATESILHQTADRIQAVYDKQYRMDEVGSRYMVLSRAANHLSDLLFIVLGAYLSYRNLLSIPNFVVIYNYLPRIRSLLTGVVQIAEFNKKFALATDRIYEIIDDEAFAKERFGNKHIDKLQGKIEFNDVVFGYDKERKVLDGMSFIIQPNERVAFVGKSGAGKTTIFNLITRMYHADSGVVKLDGYDIEALDRPSIRNNMSIITQSPYIFNFSIKENLRIAKSDASLKEMRQACKLACIDDYIMSLPDQYDTMVGEGGVILSGGQKQRLAIARALLKKTEIILFDEATSALDNETQAQIQGAINNLQGEYTILIVAHRLSTIVDSDRIFVVDGGKIIAEGSHKKLMRSCNFYRELYSKELEA